MRQLKEILGQKLYDQLKEKIGNKKLIVSDQNFIPRSRLNKVIEERNTYKKKIEKIEKELKKAQERLCLDEEYLMDLLEIHHLSESLIQRKMQQRRMSKER
ncbi:hypothetical protein [Crassaminicella profunda]|uniref:hypothetical protein n=1 Tax=Crassaminicella profunda TaxID=1286698 RepID=UPI001CA6EBB7|nr:hypothetical protein [Crassaminicella profunda]QZY55085.1 hypothetical protein K7H06_19115 [Crassaminicella profunda]